MPTSQIVDYGAASCCVEGTGGSLTSVQQKKVDDAFVQICGAIADMSMKVRLEACLGLGRLVRASEKVLIQSLSKKILLNKDTRDRDERDTERLEVNGGGGGKEEESIPMDDDDNIEVSKNAEGNMLLANVSAGVLIHALEDEFKEVRLAAIDSITKLGKGCSAFAKRASGFLLDMLSDEFHSVRVRAANALLEMTVSYDVKGDEVQGALTLAAEKSRDSRQAGYRLLVASRYGCLGSIRAAVRALLEAHSRNPQDEPEILFVLWSIGRNNPWLIECLSDELLQEANGILDGEGSIDDLAYVARLVLLLSAATSRNRNVMSLLPSHMFEHARILASKISHIPLNLDVCVLSHGVNSYIAFSSSSSSPSSWENDDTCRFPTATDSDSVIRQSGVRTMGCEGGGLTHPACGGRGTERQEDECSKREELRDRDENDDDACCNPGCWQHSCAFPSQQASGGGKRTKSSSSSSSSFGFLIPDARPNPWDLGYNAKSAAALPRQQTEYADQSRPSLPKTASPQVLRVMQGIMDGLAFIKTSVDGGCFSMALKSLRDCRAELSAIAQMAGGEISTMARFCALYIRAVAIMVKFRRAIVAMNRCCGHRSRRRHGQALSLGQLAHQLVEVTWEMEGRFQWISSALRWSVYELRIAGYLMELSCHQSQCKSAADIQETTGGNKRREGGSSENMTHSRISEVTVRKMVGLVAWMTCEKVPAAFTLLQHVKRRFQGIWEKAGNGNVGEAQSLWKNYLDQISAQVITSYWPMMKLTCNRSLNEVWADLRPPSTTADHPIEFIKRYADHIP
ncbi:hypothetical protein CBR_g8780 [Chara braunii]|uniref:Uncharacterized protein n=1 Tax=Chara braunii TaxID=69332 RepID=A0A388KMV0_CHABU|nr:hypothetical protein CBR_g8780 [Chara braunii]|eukprot:GBG71361.1 hypothetical protein CBR_g8780 [Chara braunii]